MDLEIIRNESLRFAEQLGIHLPTTLPLMEPGLKMRNSEQVISRILAMHATAAIAYGFDRIKAIAWLYQQGITDSLSAQEKRFVFEGLGETGRFQVQIEGMWALAWAMGIVNEFDFTKPCDSRFVMMLPDLKQCQSSVEFRRKANPRPLYQVVAACDLAYCLHWAIRQSELTGKRPPANLNPYVVVERRRALEWLLSKEGWDEVSLDT